MDPLMNLQTSLTVQAYAEFIQPNSDYDMGPLKSAFWLGDIPMLSALLKKAARDVHDASVWHDILTNCISLMNVRKEKSSPIASETTENSQSIHIRTLCWLDVLQSISKPEAQKHASTFITAHGSNSTQQLCVEVLQLASLVIYMFYVCTGTILREELLFTKKSDDQKMSVRLYLLDERKLYELLGLYSSDSVTLFASLLQMHIPYQLLRLTTSLNSQERPLLAARSVTSIARHNAGSQTTFPIQGAITKDAENQTSPRYMTPLIDEVQKAHINRNFHNAAQCEFWIGQASFWRAKLDDVRSANKNYRDQIAALESQIKSEV